MTAPGACLVDPNARAFFGTDEAGLEAIKEQLAGY